MDTYESAKKNSQEEMIAIAKKELEKVRTGYFMTREKLEEMEKAGELSEDDKIYRQYLEVTLGTLVRITSAIRKIIFHEDSDYNPVLDKSLIKKPEDENEN